MASAEARRRFGIACPTAVRRKSRRPRSLRIFRPPEAQWRAVGHRNCCSQRRRKLERITGRGNSDRRSSGRICLHAHAVQDWLSGTRSANCRAYTKFGTTEKMIIISTCPRRMAWKTASRSSPLIESGRWTPLSIVRRHTRRLKPAICHRGNAIAPPHRYFFAAAALSTGTGAPSAFHVSRMYSHFSFFHGYGKIFPGLDDLSRLVLHRIGPGLPTHVAGDAAGGFGTESEGDAGLSATLTCPSQRTI